MNSKGDVVAGALLVHFGGPLPARAGRLVRTCGLAVSATAGSPYPLQRGTRYPLQRRRSLPATAETLKALPPRPANPPDNFIKRPTAKVD